MLMMSALGGVCSTCDVSLDTLSHADHVPLPCAPALSWASELLGLDPMQLAEVLTHKSMILRGEEITTPLSVEQVRDGWVNQQGVFERAEGSQRGTWKGL